MSNHPLPAKGGSFIRDKDGSLKPAAEARKPAEPAPAKKKEG